MPNYPSEEIKSRLDIVDVIREYINLKPAGVNFRANCPFHREKTPSFIVSPEKQIWHCFGCGRGGDVLGFVKEMEGLSFVETLRLLAPKAGVELKRASATDVQLASKRNRLLDITKLSAQFYHKVLLEAPAGKPALKYLEKRGWSDETVKSWQLGYSPDTWDTLLNFLKSRGYSEEEIFLSGMSVRREGGGGYYDRFRGRIMFPIHDLSGQPVAFTARVSPEREATEVMGKYINSPQTLIYDKSKIIFGLDKAKSEIKAADLTIMVEGQADVITAHQAGYGNVVAASGTALTGEQVKLLKRFSNNLALSFDMDAAGEQAVERGTREALGAEMNVRVIEIPNGKDPDECIKNDPEEWKKAVTAARPVMLYHFDKVFSRLKTAEVADKRQAAGQLLPIIARLGSKIEQDTWLKKLAQAIDISENIIREMLVKHLQRPIGGEAAEAAEAAKPAEAPSRQALISQLIIALILKFPEHFTYVLNNLAPEQLFGAENQRLYKNIVGYYNRTTDNWTNGADSGDTFGESIPQSNTVTNQINYKEFRKWLEQEQDEPFLAFGDQNSQEDKPKDKISPAGGGIIVNLLDRLALLAEKDFYEHDSVTAQKEVIRAVAELKSQAIINQLKILEKEITAAEAAGDREQLKILLEEFKLLTDEQKTLGNI